MPGSGASVFTDPDDYVAALPTRIDLLPTRSDRFYARLTQVELPHLRLLHAREETPRLAFVSLPSDRLAVVFPTHPDSSLLYNGVALRPGDMAFHSRAERFHQRTMTACSWGAIFLSTKSLLEYGRVLAEQDLHPPASGRVLRLAGKDRSLLRLHRQAARITEKEPDSIAHPEVVRALDQDLIWALIASLADAKPLDAPEDGRRCATLLTEFEDTLTRCADRVMSVPEACRAIGVTERTLRTCCSHVLGMGPGRYMLLHRLRQVRRELESAAAERAAVAEITTRYGFAEPCRFAISYRRAFGVAPWPRRFEFCGFDVGASLSA